MCGSVVDIQSATAEIRREKKEKKKPQGKNIMSASATQGGHKEQYLLQSSSQYGELRSTNGRHHLASLGHLSKFQRRLRLGFVTAPTSLNEGQPNFARCLAVSWAGTLYIHFWGCWSLLPRIGILPGAKFTLRPTLAFSYIGSVTARHSSSER